MTRAARPGARASGAAIPPPPKPILEEVARDVGSERELHRSRQFLRASEAQRVHTTTLLLIAMTLGGYATLLFGHHAIATTLAAIALSIHLVGYTTIAWLTRSEHRFRRAHVGRIALVLAPATVPLIYFYGTFSPFVALVGLILCLYSLSAPQGFAIGAVALVAVPHVLLGALIAAGVLPDHGVVRGDADGQGLLMGLGSALLVYALGLVLGMSFQKRLDEMVGALEQAVGEVAAREALLREARLELERAAGIGDRGRFSQQTLGSFELGVLIGRGGMGEIYEATHVTTGEAAAVKLLQRGLSEVEADPLARFEQEARLAASMRSEHVVRVLEIGGAEAPLPYLAMERLQGKDLSTLLRDRALRLREVVEMVAQVAEALGEARERGIVHRDVKPSNLFRTDEGVWKVLDFGVARLAGDAGHLTAGHLVGTPAYMAPEQVREGAVLDHRTDVHALAAVTYRTLTGQPAFLGRDLPSVVEAVCDRLPLRPSDLAELPASVDDVLRVGLAKDPAARFDTAEAFAAALRDAARKRRTGAIAARAESLDATRTWAGASGPELVRGAS